MTVNKRTEYERTSRARAEMRAAATLLGWSVLDVLGAYLTPENEVVVVTRDGQRYGAKVSTPQSMANSEPVKAPEPVDTKLAKSVLKAAEKIPDRDELLARLKSRLEEVPENARAIALIDTLPDTPDWVDSLRELIS